MKVNDYNKVINRELNKQKYEKLSGSVDTPITQQYIYGEWQKANGKEVRRFAIEEKQATLGFFQTVKYPLPFGRSYMYIPRGPVFLKELAPQQSEELSNVLVRLADKENVVFLRSDVNLESKYFSRVPRFMYDGAFQPKYESVLDLTKSEEDILAGMKKVNRYTVRQAERLGVEVEIIASGFMGYLDKFYELISTTAERDEFAHNSKDYYRKIFEISEAEGNAFMEVARYNGEIMLINFFVIYGSSVYYLFSGSENENRRVGYTYLAQWGAIKYAKKLGLKKYNFGAVIPDDNRYPLYSGWSGFSDFKRRFGGEIVEYSDMYDLVVNKFLYRLYFVRKVLNLAKNIIFG